MKDHQCKNNSKPVNRVADDNLRVIQSILHETSDLKSRRITYQESAGMIIYLESIADTEKIQQSVIEPLNRAMDKAQPVEQVITNTELSLIEELHKGVGKLLNGSCLLTLDGMSSMYAVNVTNQLTRTPEEPSNEKVVRGSHEGFVDSLTQNLGLIRKRLENENLVIKQYVMGQTSNTKLAVVYMDDLVNKEVLAEIFRRIEGISVDMAFSPGYLEEFLENKTLSPFPQMLPTERPDRTMAHLLDGRVAVLSEGSATALILPVTFLSFFQSPDDFNSRVLSGSFFRMLRMVSFLVAMTLPAVYIAIIGFHFEILPNELILPVKASLEGIPFPPIIEAFVMVFTIELIREAGVRLPTPIGQTIGIVGGLVIGDAVVSAGFISNVMVIVIAVTAVASYTVPTYEMGSSIRILTFPLMIAASLLGFLGIVMGLIVILLHLCKLESLGTPYFSPFAPLNVSGLKDAVIRFPLWKMNSRAMDALPQNRRQHNSKGWKRK
ncbi:spore germination protein [Fictibacillus fluitans]|uniref:Spore germination protein n=1 Tax=Fictibacillus fluitans TaxID=3058422 RepID=A0ABT8HY17_9BACL|nr:spore germination protein [Fictibacillus sp. NE201]MDN4525675.1 spore germination protein [Fictibacillus sp. NE201]